VERDNNEAAEDVLPTAHLDSSDTDVDIRRRWLAISPSTMVQNENPAAAF
jgi:hypothetical protein